MGVTSRTDPSAIKVVQEGVIIRIISIIRASFVMEGLPHKSPNLDNRELRILVGILRSG